MNAIFKGYADSQIELSPLEQELISQFAFRNAKCANLTAREDILQPVCFLILHNFVKNNLLSLYRS